MAGHNRQEATQLKKQQAFWADKIARYKDKVEELRVKFQAELDGMNAEPARRGRLVQ